MRWLSKVFSTFFGAGYFPVAPGTFASLIAALLFRFFLCRLDWKIYSVLVVIVYFSGVFSARVFSKDLGQRDPRKVVIDEVCGQWITYFLAPAAWPSVAIGFFLFRLFDVLKPFPIRKSEQLPHGWGIMTDDVLAGVFSAIILQICLRLG
jgi:phosphatidylglycerophosphatase A